MNILRDEHIEKYTITNPNTNETINMVKHEHPEFIVRNKQTNQLYDSANDLESLGYEYEVTDILRSVENADMDESIS